MGARFSKVSCTCTINCHQPGVVHDHHNGVGPCQRCNHLRRLRAGAQSRTSAASTSTEYLARPRYDAAPTSDPDRARRVLPHPTLRRQRASIRRRTRNHRRAVSYPDSLPSFISTTTPGPSSNTSTNPSLSPNRSLSPSPSPSPNPSPDPSINRTLSTFSNFSMPSSLMRRNTIASFALENSEAASRSTLDHTNVNLDGDGGVNSAPGAAAEAGNARTPSDISQSSTAVCRGSEGEASLAGMSVYSGEVDEGEEDRNTWGWA